MEMLNSVSNILSGNLWTTIINFFADWIVNYGWAIIVFTICLKLVLSPLDVFQRIASQKQARVQAAMKPEMDALQAKYGADRERLTQEQNKLYKKYNVSMGGVCLPMLISLIVTLLVFFTLFSSIRSWGNEKLYSSYNEIDTAYVTATADAVETDEYLALTTDEERQAYINEYVTEIVSAKYTELSKSNSWLWVKNVWKSDTKTSQFVDFNAYADNQGLEGTLRDEAKVRYDIIVEAIQADEGSTNGYYILIILAVAVSFLTQYLSTKLSAPKGQKLNTMNKVMLCVLPISMAIFASSSNVVFTLYIITNSVMSALISTIITLITRRINKDKKPEEILLSKRNVEVVEYSRNYKK